MKLSPKQYEWRVADLLPAAAMLVVGLAALGYATMAPRGDKGNFAVLLNPWADPSEAISLVNRADAQIISFNDRMNVVVVHTARPDAVAALYKAGAWLIFEPTGLSSCLDLRVPEA